VKKAAGRSRTGRGPHGIAATSAARGCLTLKRDETDSAEVVGH